MKPRPIDYMHLKFGPGRQGVSCKSCTNLCRKQANRVWYKCLVWGDSCCDASDWRISWPSCGMYNRDPAGLIHIKDTVKHVTTHRVEEVPGQMSMFSEGE